MTRALVVDGGHLTRLMRLCRTIHADQGTTAMQLRRKLRTSRRTIFRDLKELAAAGVQVEAGRGGYRLKNSLAQCRRFLADSRMTALRELLADCLR